MNQIRTNRSFLVDLDFGLVSIPLHGYSDASANAYGAVTYLRFQDSGGNVRVQVLFAKTRVAPTKRVTLPHLELMAAYLLSKMVVFLKILDKKIEQYVCWSDSTITLNWIHKPSNVWKVFVANRIHTIQQNTDPSCWRFCPGDANPADLVTRGEPLQDLAKNLLWNGPQWLCKSPEEWPKNIVEKEPLENVKKVNKRSSVTWRYSVFRYHASRQKDPNVGLS